MARPTQEQVEAEIAGLAALSLEELRERWRVLYGNPAPRSLRRDLLMRAVAYQIQVKAFGGLSVFEWKGTRYRSLSLIAKTITSTNWNGWTFFGVKRGTRREGRDSLGRFNGPVVAPDGSRVWPRSRRNGASTNGAAPTGEGGSGA
jgi:hypothetical protein